MFCPNQKVLKKKKKPSIKGGNCELGGSGRSLIRVICGLIHVLLLACHTKQMRETSQYQLLVLGEEI